MLLNFSISYESVKKSLKTGDGLYWLNEKLGLSEYYELTPNG